MKPRPDTLLLLTARTGVGKTAVLRKIGAALPYRRLAGFITEEVRDGVTGGEYSGPSNGDGAP